jgi:hypothetical protein
MNKDVESLRVSLIKSIKDLQAEVAGKDERIKELKELKVTVGALVVRYQSS